MTLPGDRPPLPPEHGFRKHWLSNSLLIAAAVLTFTAAALSRHYGWPALATAIAAAVCAVAAVAVLAGKGRQS